jgi:hypothetical protein
MVVFGVSTKVGISDVHPLRACNPILSTGISIARSPTAWTTSYQDGELALQLRVPFEVGFLSGGLMASAPDGPGDDESGFDATLDQTPGNTTDLLE